MAYYCFLCNENHDDSPTKEHFIPQVMGAPKRQWLPVCKDRNKQSNSVFDSDVRDILYWVRFKKTKIFTRSGEALLSDGTLKRCHFSYRQEFVPELRTTFLDIFDKEKNARILPSHVYAIKVPVGMTPDEKEKFCRGLARMSIGALAYLLKKQGVEDQTIRQIFLQTSVDAVRHFALNLSWHGNTVALRFSLGESDVLMRLQRSCKNQQTCNHVIKINFRDDNSIHIEGMLYSQHGWMLNLSNQIAMQERELRLENSVARMNVPDELRDLTLSLDLRCIKNSNYKGQEPKLPRHWWAS